MTVGLLSFASLLSAFNGGRSQVNFNFPNGGGGEYPFANLIKTSGVGLQGSNTLITPDICDSNGYITSFPSGVTNTQYSLAMPSQNSRSGFYTVTWLGSGSASITISAGTTTQGGSQNPVAGVGSWTFSFNSATANSCILAFNAPVTAIRFYHVTDAAAVIANENAFHPQFIATNKTLKFGVNRFLNWINGNNGTSTTWATRKPQTYFSFGQSQLNNAEYGGVCTSNSGSDYIVNASSSWTGIADKAVISFVFNAAGPASNTATFNSSTTSITVTAHGLATGNQCYLTTSGSAPGGFTAYTSSQFPTGSSPVASYTSYFVTVIDPNTLTLSATSGGSAIQASSAGSSVTLNPIPTIKVGSSAVTPIWDHWSLPYPQALFLSNGTSYFGAPSLARCTYDAVLGAFISFGGGNDNGVPPEVCLQLCAQLGAHPYFVAPFLSCDPATDYVPELCSLIKTTYQNGSAPWMIPRIETPNECWNTASTFDTRYAAAKAAAYGWSSQTNYDDWIGKVGSIVGQLCASVFGYSNKGTKYHSYIGVQTTNGTSQTFGTGSAIPRFASTKFINNDPNSLQSPLTYSGGTVTFTRSPGFVWCSDLVMANYFSPTEQLTIQEVVDGYNWTHNNSPGQAAIAGNYVDTVGGAAAGFNVAQVTVYATNWVAFGQGVTQGQTTWTAASVNYTFGVKGYEGGYSPDYLNADIISAISGATVTSSTTVQLTLATTVLANGVTGSTSGNPAVVGMYLKIASVGGMTQLNGNTYQVSIVSGTTVTVTVPDTTGFGTYTSGGSATYFDNASATVHGYIWPNNLRGAGKLCTSSTGQPGTGLQGWLTTFYNQLVTAGMTFPSCFQFGGLPPTPGTDVWSILDDTYQPLSTSPQALAIQAFNN